MAKIAIPYEQAQLEREARHTAAVAESNFAAASSIRNHARRAATVRALPPPAWAAVTKPKQRQETRSLNARRQSDERALGPEVKARLEAARAVRGQYALICALQRRAKLAASRLGRELPEWATQKPIELAVSYRSTTNVSVTIPEPLRQWRERNPGSIVEVGQLGVVLHILGEPKQMFPDVASAIAAVAS